MISVCTVVTNNIIDKYLHNFLDSLVDHTKLVKEIIIVNCEQENQARTFYLKNKDINLKYLNYYIPDRAYQHPLGLHVALDNTTQEYVLFSDPDIIFYAPVDEIYKNLIDKYNLFIVGIAHHTALGMTMQYFPCVQNCLIKKDKLPNADYLKGSLKMRFMLAPGHLFQDWPYTEETALSLDGKYLIHGPIPELWKNFPAPELNLSCDTGCNLCLYCNDIGGKWLSFQTLDCHNYTTKIYKTNFKLKDNLGNIKLLHHATNSCNSI